VGRNIFLRMRPKDGEILLARPIIAGIVAATCGGRKCSAAYVKFDL
jgi:hypothetical protein